MYVYIYIYKCLWQKNKSPKQPSEETQMANPDIKIITGTKVKYLSEKQNGWL